VVSRAFFNFLQKIIGDPCFCGNSGRVVLDQGLDFSSVNRNSVTGAQTWSLESSLYQWGLKVRELPTNSFPMSFKNGFGSSQAAKVRRVGLQKVVLLSQFLRRISTGRRWALRLWLPFPDARPTSTGAARSSNQESHRDKEFHRLRTGVVSVHPTVWLTGVLWMCNRCPRGESCRHNRTTDRLPHGLLLGYRRALRSGM
jgi:hypothetical protein